MKTTIRYSGEDKQRKACADTLSYLGPRRYKLLASATRTQTRNGFKVLMAFVGVEGYPVEAMMDRYSSH